MSLICLPYTGAESYLFIDPASPNGFQMYDLFQFTETTPILGRSLTRDYVGNAHVVDRYYKDTFRLVFPKLTASQCYALKVLLQQLGVNALHTVIYGGTGINGALEVRKYDNATQYAAGYGINDDVQRLRKQVLVTKQDYPHWLGISNIFTATIECEEA